MLMRKFAVAAVLCATPALVRAQVRSDAGAAVDGRIAVKVYVTLADESQPYYPVARHRLTFFRGLADSTAVRTDDAGVVTVLLPLGDYRIVSEPVDWHGARYHWNVPATVRSGMAVVDLTARNATVTPRDVAVSASAGVPASATPPVPAVVATSPVTTPTTVASPGAQAIAPQYLYKDPTTATLFSLLIAGGGQYYAGEPGRGTFFLLADLIGVALVLDGANRYATCDGYYSSCDDGSGEAGAGLGIALGASLVSLIDAHNAAHRHNRRVGLEPAPRRVGVLVAPGPHRGARVGLTLALRH